MYGFKICDVPRILCATPEYLADMGKPTHPRDLAQHNALLYQLSEVLQDEWLFNDGTQDHKVKLKGNRASNDADLVRRWCIAGKGVAIKSCLDMSRHLLSGEVIDVMPEFKPTATELWLVCPSRQSITPTVRLLRDLFRGKTAEILSQLSEQGIIETQHHKL